MIWQSLLIDLILLVIIGFFVFTSARRGFVRVAVEAFGILAAIVLTLTICTPLSISTYDTIIEPQIIKSVNAETEESFEQTVDKVIVNLPDFLQGYLTDSEITDKIMSENEAVIQGGTVDLVKNISQNTIKPITVKIISAVYSAIILAVSFVIVKVLARFLNKCFSFSVVGKLNNALGGVCGFVKGVAIVLLICFIISFLVSVTENGIWIFNNENIEKTYIFRFLISLGDF